MLTGEVLCELQVLLHEGEYYALGDEVVEMQPGAKPVWCRRFIAGGGMGGSAWQLTFLPSLQLSSKVAIPSMRKKCSPHQKLDPPMIFFRPARAQLNCQD